MFRVRVNTATTAVRGGRKVFTGFYITQRNILRLFAHKLEIMSITSTKDDAEIKFIGTSKIITMLLYVVT